MSPWTCTVTPFDGEVNGSSGSDTIQVDEDVAHCGLRIQYVDLGTDPASFNPIQNYG